MTTSSERCLRNLGLQEEYRSDRDDLLSDFFIPCLDIATKYDRAVGYFTSSGLAAAGRGLSSFTARDGRARLVASPNLTADDVAAMSRGIKAREDTIARRLLDALAEAEPPPDNLVMLAWLVANRRLDVRLAVPISSPGIYHEKAGIFEDGDGCRVAFGGSANETIGGLISNFETVDVFFSWDTSLTRVERKVANFQSLWDGRTTNLSVLELPEAVEQELITISERHAPRVMARARPVRRLGPMQPPPEFAPRDYQEAAVDAWISREGRGILSMATGSGKTKTALSAVARLLADQGSATATVVVVAVPYIHLVDQWADECKEWGLTPIRCYESSTSWLPAAQEAIDSATILKRPITLATTIRTATLPPFQRLLDLTANQNVVLVGDEVHHLGAAHAALLLRPTFRWRLGLSATPRRWQDDAGTDLLESYFGGIVFEFSLAEAIAAGRLVPYYYEPILVELDREELKAYRDVMLRIEQVARERDEAGPDRLLKMLDERSRILNQASGKPTHVRDQIVGRRLSHTLFYCASRLQMGAVSDVVRAEGHIPRPFTAEEDRRTRAEVLGGFEAGQIPAIVAMRALDEGVDIPDTREAHLLASSGNPREFIQRRGRILRPAPGKVSARLVDYVVVPEGTGVFERQIVEREMTRVLDFAASSLEPDLAREAVWPILNGYDLIHLMGR